MKNTKHKDGVNYRDIDDAFESEYGIPKFNQTIQFTNGEGKPIFVIPLTDEQNTLKNILIGFEEDQIETYRVINKNLGESNGFKVNELEPCYDSRLGVKNIEGLIKTSKDILSSNESRIIDINLNSLPDGCYELVLNCDECPLGWGLIEVECPNTDHNQSIDDVEDSSGGGVTDNGDTGVNGGGNTGTDNDNTVGGNTTGGDVDATEPNDTTTGTIDPCGADPFGYDLECFEANEAFNEEMSEGSPVNVDFSALNPCNITLPDSTDAATKKFKCIYKKLTETPKFKQLFVDTFGEDSDFNVNFQIVDLPPNSNGFVADAVTNGLSLTDFSTQTISFDKTHLLDKHPLSIAQTIIHEALHAFMNIHQIHCYNVQSIQLTQAEIDALNQYTMDELFNNFSLECTNINVLDHRLMYNRMLDVMEEMLTEVFDDLVHPNDQDLTNNPHYMYECNTCPAHTFNWEDAFYYLNLGGLEKADEYLDDIQQNSSIAFFTTEYPTYLNDPLKFIQNTCNE